MISDCVVPSLRGGVRRCSTVPRLALLIHCRIHGSPTPQLWGLEEGAACVLACDADDVP